MFKDSMQGVSNLSFALFSSLKDIVLRNTFETTIGSSIQFIEGGDIYIPYSKKYGTGTGQNEFPTFTPGSHEGYNPAKNSQCPFQEFKSNHIDKHITTIIYNKAISIASMLEQLSKEKKVYGVVIQYQNNNCGEWHSFNPLHPMVAFLIMAGLMKLPDEGKLHVFEYKDRSITGDLEFTDTQQQVIDGFKKDYEKFFEISDNIHKKPFKMKQHATLSQTTISDIIDDPFVENIHAVVDIHKEADSINTQGIEMLIIPNHLIMDGTASPYYGIATIINPTSESIKGLALGPMATGNISLYQNNDDDYRTYSEFYESASSSNVCTGSENSITPRGWFTLSKVNLDSMYYNNVIDMNHIFEFIHASKELSGEIWEAYNKIQEDSLIDASTEAAAEAAEAPNG